MDILIVGAMTEEISFLVYQFNLTSIDSINGYNLYSISKPTSNTYILNCGIGKVESAITMSMFLSKYDVDKIISIGTSGAINDQLQIGDLVNGNKLAYHDVDVSGFGYPLGQLPGKELYFTTTNDQWWNQLLEKLSAVIDCQLYHGTIVTGDQFINSEDAKKFITNTFDNVYSVEMESTAIVHAAQAFNKDIYVLRSVSDQADGQADISFDEYLKQVCIKYKHLVDLVSNE